MKKLRSSHHASAKRLADRLMTETDSQHRNLAAELLNHAERHARIVGRARPGRNHNAFRLQLRFDFGDGHLVVAADAWCELRSFFMGSHLQSVTTRRQSSQ